MSVSRVAISFLVGFVVFLATFFGGTSLARLDSKAYFGTRDYIVVAGLATASFVLGIAVFILLMRLTNTRDVRPYYEKVFGKEMRKAKLITGIAVGLIVILVSFGIYLNNLYLILSSIGVLSIAFGYLVLWREFE